MSNRKKTKRRLSSRQIIQREVTFMRMQRLASEGKWEELAKEYQGLRLAAQEEQEVDAEALREFHNLVWQQALRSTGREGELTEAFRVCFLYNQLDPRDGVDAALAGLIIALTNTTMECFRRASVSDALPVRDLELNYAMKGTLITSALTKALDNHRERSRHPKKTR